MSGVGVAFELLLLGHGQMVQQMHSLGVHPLIPTGGVFPQQIARQDAVAARVLHVDVQVGATHRDHDVEVDLQRVRHPFFDGEEVRLMPAVPATELGHGEDGGREQEEQCGVTPGGAAAGVRRFGFGCRGHADQPCPDGEETLASEEKADAQGS